MNKLIITLVLLVLAVAVLGKHHHHGSRAHVSQYFSEKEMLNNMIEFESQFEIDDDLFTVANASLMDSGAPHVVCILIVENFFLLWRKKQFYLPLIFFFKRF